MTTTDTPVRVTPQSLNALFDCLASGPRRYLLGRLAEQRPGSVARAALADALASWESTEASRSATAETRERALASLHHTHLPKLAAADLIELDDDGETVTLADHPALADAGVRETICDADASSLDALFRALADSRRRTALDVLSHQLGPVHVETLARDIGARERDTTESAVPTPAVERTRVALRHRHLPLLSEADLIEYDTADQTVAYEGGDDGLVDVVHQLLGSRLSKLDDESEDTEAPVPF